MRRLLFTSLCENASRRTRDVMYRLLTDALPYGVRCCKRSCTKGEMRPLLVPAGQARGGIDAPRPPRVHLLATRDGRNLARLYRGNRRRRRAHAHAAQHNVAARFAAPSNARDRPAPRRRPRRTARQRSLARAHRSNTLHARKRRNCNAYFAMPLAYDATDAYRDARALAQTVATACASSRWRRRSGSRFTTTTGCHEDGKSPIDKWTAAWIETGAAEVTQGGSVRLLLPATLGDIPGAETQIPDIRDQPGGDALFQFWMEKRRREDERLGRDRDRAGVGVGTG